ncbi:MAG: hypothetical protein ABI698_03235 [bacterium]
MRSIKLVKMSALILLTSAIGAVQAQAPRRANAKSATGHYRLTKDEFRNRLDVQQLAGGKIKFYLLALWVSHNYPDNIHNGELQGIVALQSGVALYDQDDCKLKFEFFASRVRVAQLKDEGCGFGANVTAAGTYRKLDSKKPKFDF